MKENYSGESFSFKLTSKDDIIEAVKKILSNRASILNDIPISCIKNFATYFFEKFESNFNNCLKKQISEFN